MARTKPAEAPKLTSITLIPPPSCTASLYTSDALRGTTMGTVYVQVNLPATKEHRQAVADWLRTVADSVATAAAYSLDGGDFESKDLGVLIALKQAGSLTPEQVRRLDAKLATQEQAQKTRAAVEELTAIDEAPAIEAGPEGIAHEILGKG